MLGILDLPYGFLRGPNLLQASTMWLSRLKAPWRDSISGIWPDMCIPQGRKGKAHDIGPSPLGHLAGKR